MASPQGGSSEVRLAPCTPQRHSAAMHDIRLVRDNPAAFDAGLARRGLAPLSAEILAADASLRALQSEIQGSPARRNAASTLLRPALSTGPKDRAENPKAGVAESKAA